MKYLIYCFYSFFVGYVIYLIISSRKRLKELKKRIQESDKIAEEIFGKNGCRHGVITYTQDAITCKACGAVYKLVKNEKK